MTDRDVDAAAERRPPPIIGLMPTYEYACQSCGRHVEVFQKFSEDSLTTCEVCGGALRKVFHPAGILFKGSGFYATDSRRKSSSSSGGDKGGDKKKDSGGDSKKDSESATRSPTRRRPRAIPARRRSDSSSKGDSSSSGSESSSSSKSTEKSA